MVKPTSTSAGSRIMRPATCMYEEGVSMYRNVASIPVSRCMVPESSQHDLAAQPPAVDGAVAEPLDLTGQESPGRVREGAGIEHVVPGRSSRRSLARRGAGRQGAP